MGELKTLIFYPPKLSGWFEPQLGGQRGSLEVEVAKGSEFAREKGSKQPGEMQRPNFALGFMLSGGWFAVTTF